MTTTERRPARCFVCGARACLCGAETTGVELTPNFPRSSGTPTTYAFGAGAHPSAAMATTLRLHSPEAIYYGVEPGPDGELAPLLRRRLTRAGVDVELFARHYKRLTETEQRNALRSIAALDDSQLLEAAALLDLDPIEDEDPFADPSAPATEDGGPPADGRVGDVVAWVNKGDGDVERFARAHRALEAERAGKARSSLIELLERILEEE